MPRNKVTVQVVGVLVGKLVEITGKHVGQPATPEVLQKYQKELDKLDVKLAFSQIHPNVGELILVQRPAIPDVMP